MVNSQSNVRFSLPIRIVIAIWAITLLVGMFVVTAYSTSPGQETATATMWPSDTEIERSTDAPTVLMFLHPHCVCSRASMREMQRLLSTNTVSVRFLAVYYCPADETDEWTQTALLAQVENVVPGSANLDHDGIEARRFGVTTSGHVLVYSPSGQCLYSGGITGRRGHEGQNYGVSGAELAIDSGTVSRLDFPVFGCPIVNSPGANP